VVYIFKRKKKHEEQEEEITEVYHWCISIPIFLMGKNIGTQNP